MSSLSWQRARLLPWRSFWPIFWQGFRRMFSRKWILATFLVLAGLALLIRLGFWQLDRLAQRRAFNARVQAQVAASPLHLDGRTPPAGLAEQEYRQVFVTGVFDFEHEVALRNQAQDGRFGVHLLTPLRIKGSLQTVLVDRGWIPEEDYSAGNWSRFAEPGRVEVRGVIRRSQDRPDFGWRSDPTPVPGGPPLKAWNFVNIAGIARQLPYGLLPVYIQQAPDPAWQALPVRSQPTLDLTEGPHEGYALQWFSFAVILGIGYPFFIHRQETPRQKPK